MIKYSIKYCLQRLFPQKFILNKIDSLGHVILTFDDGPHPENTLKILRILRERRIRAVFFVSGSELEKYQEIGMMIIEDGHLLGNHTYDHLNINKCSFSQYRNSIEKAQALINSMKSDNHDPKLFRPPYGAFSLKLFHYLFVKNYLLFNWTIDSRDSFILNPTDLIERFQTVNLQNGDILLFHEDYSHTVEALSIIIDYYLEKDLKFDLPF